MLDPLFTHYSSYPALALRFRSKHFGGESSGQFDRPGHGVADAPITRHARSHGVRSRSRGRGNRTRAGSRAGSRPALERYTPYYTVYNVHPPYSCTMRSHTVYNTLPIRIRERIAATRLYSRYGVLVR